MLKSKKIRVLAIAVAMMGALAAIATPADAARRAKCFATPVPGQPGVEIVTCTTTRP